MSGSDGQGVRTRFQKPPGESFIAIATQVGHTRGIEIDNPCGSWLYIPSLETFIPPYTTGWAFGFPYDVAAVDVLSRDRVPTGPAAQVSTLQGDPVVIYLTDLELTRKEGVTSGNAPSGSGSVGSPTSDQNFITAFTPIESGFVNTSSTVGGFGTTATMIAAIPNKRFRVYSWNVARIGDFLGFDFAISPVTCQLVSSIGFAAVRDRIRLQSGQHEQTHLWTQGLDFPVGASVDVNVQPDWTDLDLNHTCTYSTI